MWIRIPRQSLPISLGLICLAGCSAPPLAHERLFHGLDAVESDLSSASGATITAAPALETSAEALTFDVVERPRSELAFTPSWGVPPASTQDVVPDETQDPDERLERERREAELARDPDLDDDDLDDDDLDEDDVCEWALQTGAGFTLGPDMFLVPFVLEARVDENVYVGPSVQFAHANSREFLGIGAEVRVELADADFTSDDFEDRIVPFVTGGLGAAYLEKQDRARDDDEWALMIDAGAGAEYRIDPRVSIGTRVVLDWFVDDLVGERFMFTWQVVTLRIRF